MDPVAGETPDGRHRWRRYEVDGERFYIVETRHRAGWHHSVTIPAAIIDAIAAATTRPA